GRTWIAIEDGTSPIYLMLMTASPIIFDGAVERLSHVTAVQSISGARPATIGEALAVAASSMEAVRMLPRRPNRRAARPNRPGLGDVDFTVVTAIHFQPAANSSDRPQSP